MSLTPITVFKGLTAGQLGSLEQSGTILEPKDGATIFD